MTCLWTPVLAPPALIASVTGLDTKITGHNQLLGVLTPSQVRHTAHALPRAPFLHPGLFISALWSLLTPHYQRLFLPATSFSFFVAFPPHESLITSSRDLFSQVTADSGLRPHLNHHIRYVFTILCHHLLVFPSSPTVVAGED